MSTPDENSVFCDECVKKIRRDSFKKGYAKGVLDCEYGQISSKEILKIGKRLKKQLYEAK